MSFSARIGGLKAAVKRLEAAAGKGQWCARCRLELRRSWADPKSPEPKPEDVIKAKCEFCGTEYSVGLKGVPEGERQIFRLSYSFTLEDQYTNPRAHAVALWVEHRLQRKMRPPTGLLSPLAKAKKESDVRALAELRDEAKKLKLRKQLKLVGKYGVADPFPEHEQLIKSILTRVRPDRADSPFVAGLLDLEMEESRLFICAALEKIILGEALPEREPALEEIGRKIDELIRTAKEDAARLKEQQKRDHIDFLNKNRERSNLPPLPYDHYDKKPPVPDTPTPEPVPEPAVATPPPILYPPPDLFLPPAKGSLRYSGRRRRRRS